jgi:hypothetical protein
MTSPRMRRPESQHDQRTQFEAAVRFEAALCNPLLAETKFAP